MSRKKITHIHFHWGSLIFAVFLSFGCLLVIQSNQTTQFLIAVSFAIFYFFWGVVHNLALGKKQIHSIFEYFALSILIIVIAYLMFINR